MLQLLHDLVIGVTSQILGHDIPDGPDRVTGRLLVLLIGEAPVFRYLGSGSGIDIFLQILCNKEMHCYMLAVLDRVSPASTNTLSIAMGMETTNRTGVR
jgi:hypothetical protein